MQEYRDAHSTDKIVGKTPEEIIKAYGEPYGRHSAGDQINFIMYRDGKHGQYCGIDFENGVAVRVSFWGQ
jgi:hypothetical protein